MPIKPENRARYPKDWPALPDLRVLDERGRRTGAAMIDIDAEVLRCQVDSLRDALLKVLDTREKEAKAYFSFENAKDNFSDRGAVEAKRHLAAMTAASNAEKEARLLLATLKCPNVRAETPTPAQKEQR